MTGIQNDPIREFLKEKGNYKALLIEPIPFYISKLRELYIGRDDVEIIQAACGKMESTNYLFYINPKIAGEMNGDGPYNDWSHGQGSFSKETIKYWIDKNKFRGENYVKNINKYYNSIEKIELKTSLTCDFIISD